MMIPLTVSLLGPFDCRDCGGTPVRIQARKNRALLAVLELSPGLMMTRERLASLLWGDRQDEQARSSLRQSLALLRKDLGEVTDAVFFAKDEVVGLRPEGVTIDAVEMMQAEKSDDLTSIRRAAALYRGDLLADYGGRDESFESWLSFERSKLRQVTVRVFERCAQLETGQAALAAARQLVELDPLREASHRRLMETLAILGDRALALRQYDELKKLLKEELGIEPSHETRALVDRLSGEDKPVTSPPIVSQRPKPAAGLRPTLAVLPFKNLSGDSSQDFFSDGITDDIITELSRFRNLQVFARRSSFANREATTATSIAQELGATYVLEGSVRKQGPRVRVTVQLSQAASGEQVWSERFDQDQTDILSLQEELARHIAGSLAIELDDRELDQVRNKHLEDIRAYDHWLKGKRILWTEGASNLQAREHFQRAADIDPGFARAFAGLAVTYVEEAVQFPPEFEFKAALANGFSNAQRAITLDNAECLGYASMGWSLFYMREYELAHKHAGFALRLNSNDSDMLANAAYVLAMYGDGERAVQCGKAALRLNPRHSDSYLGFMGTALFSARRYQEGIEVRSRSPDTFYDSRFFGASMLARLGRLEEARQWAAIGMKKLEDRVGRSRIGQEGYIKLLLNNNPLRKPEDIDHFAESMRLAGIPD